MLGLALSLASFQQTPQPQPVPADSAAVADTAAVSVVAAVGEAVGEADQVAGVVADDLARMRVRPIVSIGALYSGSRGLGVGGGFAASNVAARGDHLQVEARVAQRVQGVHGAYMTGEPERSVLYATLAGSIITSSRFPFQGTGPHADPDGELFLDRLEYEAEARLGWQPAGVMGPLVQPFVRYRADRLRGFEETPDGSLALVSAGDRARLDADVGATRRGVGIGLGVQSDSRNNEGRPTRGAFVSASAERFFNVDGTGLRFNQAEVLGYVFRPSPVRLPFQAEPGAVFVRVSGVVTRPDGDSELPVVYLPRLDRDRLVGWPVRSFPGRDALSVGVGARGVLVRSLRRFRLEGIALGVLGAAYDDVFREFTPRVSLSNTAVPDGENVPLQPSVGLGLNLHSRDRERPLIGVLVGVGPGGLTVTSFRLVFGIDRYRPDVR